MTTCLSCGHDNTDDARFCSQCATPLDVKAAAREERKVVTVLFCDLVGFTARAERMDPEDVRAVLAPYHARVRADLERFGGTVEKFIGDAVMAVFGAPVAHEDDPERAVRAALAIRDTLVEEELDVRIGITTGEALITLGARPEAGEGMAAGDVVNTAARLQSAAATNAILVDETTYRATERAIEYREAQPVDAKGKSEPVIAREARAARARVGVERVGGASLVGRDQELTLLRETLARVIREREPQLVTLVGVPGIGKSRLVYELFQTIETGTFGLVFWRHGRSLPYGEGVTFWALGEMIKAQAGILESDSHEQAGGKLGHAVARFVDDTAEAAWIERHLRPLSGLETDEAWAGDRREEAFSAWRRFLEAIADERPLVLVFEDLQWADDALLDFVDYLAEWVSGVPLLVLCTARPELLARRPAWGGGKVNASTLQLSPLSDEQTAVLVHALLGSSVVDADLQTRLLEHAGGNPLYAEEFTRMVTSRQGDVVLPETVQGIIAARLDTLPAEEKELLQDAAVMGRTFWLGALDGERWTLEERLHSLTRKEFVSRERRSTVAGENEYTFRHALVREVAYEQIPRVQRADKHRRAAEWIESLGRTEDHAEMLAHHYLRALELARAAGQPIVGMADRALSVFIEAGDRAFALNSFATSARYYGEALALGGDGTQNEGELRLRRARALFVAGGSGSDDALEEARTALLATGDAVRAAEADALLAELWWYRGESTRSSDHLERAYASVRDLAPSHGKARVLSQVARYRMLAGSDEEAIQIGAEALAVADDLGIPELRAHALINIGTAKVNRGDASGLEDLERAIEIAVAAGSSEVARALNNLAVSVRAFGDLRRGRRLMDEAVAHAERLGIANQVRFSRNVQLWLLFQEGSWDVALPPTEEFLAACEAGESHYHEGGMRLARADVRLARDDVEGALDDIRKVVELARRAGDPQQRVPWLSGAARVLVETGEREEARPLAHEAIGDQLTSMAWGLVDLAFVASGLGCADELAEQLERGPQTTWTDASRVLLQGDFVAGADLLHEIGDTKLEAFARLRAAERLVAEGRRPEADEQLQRSLAFWRSVRATRYVREAEALLAAAS
ncbi:MAG TPA: adenylate/guanylate cyclase domain-containing protein [Gaiellaceae bacterium]|nr:adenylate/guanylate cyclase domain-containing protein [Gaiellaceae bacterium]